MIRRLPLLASLLLLSGCTRLPLQIDSEYISRENLASYHIRTPDPLLNCSHVGQRLVLTWSLPPPIARNPDTLIVLTIIFGNHTTDIINIHPKSCWNIYSYTLLNDEYFDRCGILTYKADLYAGEKLLYTWKHQLWMNLITFPEEEKPMVNLENLNL